MEPRDVHAAVEDAPCVSFGCFYSPSRLGRASGRSCSVPVTIGNAEAGAVLDSSYSGRCPLSSALQVASITAWREGVRQVVFLIESQSWLIKIFLFGDIQIQKECLLAEEALKRRKSWLSHNPILYLSSPPNPSYSDDGQFWISDTDVGNFPLKENKTLTGHLFRWY